jgi:hypothetical protein
MDRGQVAEFDAPINLMRNPRSIFYSMCEKSGNFATLFNIAADYMSQLNPDAHRDLHPGVAQSSSAVPIAVQSDGDGNRIQDLMGDEYMSYHIIDL